MSCRTVSGLPRLVVARTFLVFSREKRENLRGCARCLLAEDEIPVNKWEGKDTPTRVVLLVLIQERNTRGTVNVAETRDLTFPHRRRGYTRRSSWRRISPACSLGANTPSSDRRLTLAAIRQVSRIPPFAGSRSSWRLSPHQTVSLSPNTFLRLFFQPRSIRMRGVPNKLCRTPS